MKNARLARAASVPVWRKSVDLKQRWLIAAVIFMFTAVIAVTVKVLADFFGG